MLLACADTDEESIVRSWDMLVLGTVLNPGTGNMLCMDYLGCLADPFSSVDLAWDQHILDECMKHVNKIQEKKKMLKEKGVMSGDFWISGPLLLLGVCTCFTCLILVCFSVCSLCIASHCTNTFPVVVVFR